MKDYYTYQETLDIVEKFMIETGVREYCETICKGKCCGSCYESKYACRKNEGRRLSCSTMICNKLVNLLFTEKEKQLYENLDLCMWRKFVNDCDLSDIYFNIHTNEVQKKFKIAKRMFSFIRRTDIDKVKSKIQYLISNNIQTYPDGYNPYK